MMSKHKSAICIFGKYMQNNLPVMLGPISYPIETPQPARHIKKHWDPKFKRLRAQKVVKVELPDFEETPGFKTDDEYKEKMRSRIRQLGFVERPHWSERQRYLSCTHEIFESYVVPEGDGKFSVVTKEGAKQKYEFLEKKGKSYMAIRKIKSYDEDFSIPNFLQDALDIYIKAHELLANRAGYELLKYVTETAYPKMIHNTETNTIHWKFLRSQEPAKVVHARCTHLVKKENVFAQLTVRFHTQQMLSIYDRFGRLLKGSEILSKDVLDYIVFEKYIADEYSTWRIHGKIVPDWMKHEDPTVKTYVRTANPIINTSDVCEEHKAEVVKEA